MHGRLVGAGVVLALVAGGGLVVDHATAARAEAEQRRADSASYAAQLLPDRPIAIPRIWVQALARDDYGQNYRGVCFLLDDAAERQFAASRGKPNCQEAARDMASEIQSGFRLQYIEYMSIDWAAVQIAPGGKSATVDACTLRWEPSLLSPRPMPTDGSAPGPQLGRLVATHVPGVNGGGFRVTSYEPCPPPRSPGTSAPGRGAPSTSPAPDTPTTEPSAAPRLLPTHAAGYPGVLARRWADGHHGCGYFSPAGARAFAAAWGAPDCESAAAKIRTRITDPTRYRTAPAAPVTGRPRGRVVDGCALRWPTLDRSAPDPGPQVGRLVLERPDGSTGYWITGYQRC